MTSVITDALLRATLDSAAEAIVVCTAADDQILLLNDAARRLVPGLAVGGSLTGVTLSGQRRALGDDHYAWYLHSTLLEEAGRRLSSTLHQGRCCRITVELAVAHLADAAMVVLPDERGQSRWVRLVADGTLEDGTVRESELVEVPGLSEALGGFPPIPSRWLDAAQVPGWLGFGPVGALLVIPLPGNAEPAGALILTRLTGSFGPDDETLARNFAARAGAAISAAALYREQVETAAVLQADLLPPDLPQPDGFELVGSYQAALGIGGDFYDAFGPTDEHADTVIALGDVCGKGPEAAVLTGKVRQTLRALRLVGTPPAEMLKVLNRALLESSRQHRFVTMVVGTVRRAENGRVRLSLATGGHPPPLVLRQDGRVEEVPITGTLIGAVRRTVVRPADVELAPGELCLLYSDGLTEAWGGPTGSEQWGESRLADALSSCAGMPAAATVERLRQLVSDWLHGGAKDDIAMLAVRAPHVGPRRGLVRNTSPYAVAREPRTRQNV
jgi:GAF domain-containing protein